MSKKEEMFPELFCEECLHCGVELCGYHMAKHRKNTPSINNMEGHNLTFFCLGENVAKCVICGYEGTEKPDQYENSILYWQGEPICMTCREDYSLELDAGIKPSHIKKV